MEPTVEKKALKAQKTKTQQSTTEPSTKLRSFLEEDIHHLFTEKTFLTQCILLQDPVSLIQKIYFDSEYPQNHILRVHDGELEVYQVAKTVGKWRQYSLEKVLDDLVSRVHHILNWHKLKHIKEIGRIADVEGFDYEASLKWIDQLYDDNIVRADTKQLIKDVLLHKQV